VPRSADRSPADIAQGNRSEALRQYDLCRRLLHDRVGLAPSPAIEAAIAPLRA
jgi:hypothetical protein